jgi:hypothetical protein
MSQRWAKSGGGNGPAPRETGGALSKDGITQASSRPGTIRTRNLMGPDLTA